MLRSRDLTWDGCLNVRDLGGHPTADGGETSFGSIVRADSVGNLTAEGWEALADYGIRTVIDLRGDHEREDDPPRELPVEVLHIPFFVASDKEWEEIAGELEHLDDLPVSDATRDAYLIFLERFKPNVAAAVRAVAEAPEGGVVVHCVGGKDRTGLLTALLLHLAGVPTEEIAADYALSEERLRPRHEGWFAAAETEAERRRLERIAQTPPESISGVFDELDRRYGSVEGYLRAAGVSEDDLVRARARLRD
ncbi:MAG TPA: tyrosine-protein phosphatase [Gaiellaceae bacterium]